MWTHEASISKAGLPVLDSTRAYTPELAGYLANWAGFGSSYDANGHGMRLMPTTTQIPNRITALDSLARPSGAFLMVAIEFVFRMHRLAAADPGPREEAVSVT